jgi:hypothetical protein
MSTGINLGFEAPLLVVDIENEQWFTELLGVPDLPDAIDANKLGEARALVLAGLKSAIADGVDPAAVAVIVPDGSVELASAAAALGALAPPRLVYVRVDATIGDHARNAAGAAALAARADAAHVSDQKLICAVRLNTSAGTPGAHDDIARAIEGMQRGGVEPDAWIVDPFDDAAGERAVVDQARSGGRVNVVVATRGQSVLADHAYGDALRAWASGDTDSGAAADQIGTAIAAAAGSTAAR